MRRRAGVMPLIRGGSATAAPADASGQRPRPVHLLASRVPVALLVLLASAARARLVAPDFRNERLLPDLRINAPDLHLFGGEPLVRQEQDVVHAGDRIDTFVVVHFGYRLCAVP